MLRSLVPSKKESVLILIGIVFVTTVLLLVLPLWPALKLLVDRPDPNRIGYAITIPQDTDIKLTVADRDVKPIPTENRLVIPKMGVDSEILEGDTLDILSQKEGVWREPISKTPTDIGNMVIAGHRFQYLPPNTNTFYNIEDMAIGDQIVILWQSKVYVYETYQTETVTPDQIEIRNDDPNIPHEITIYACTPLYTSTDRFVVKAKLIN